MSVTVVPSHTEEADAEEVTDGRVFTPTATVDVLLHPFTSVPVTVYVVAPDGVSVTDVPLNDPGIQS